MKKIAIAMLAFGALATSFASGASASAPADTDFLCGFTSATDPNPEAPDNTQTGEIDGGPIAQNGTIFCSIQVGNALHSASNQASAQATGTNGVTILTPTLISYVSPSLTPVYLCDQFTDAGGTVYVFDDTDGVWEVNNGTATCRLAISGGTDDPLLDPIEEAIDGVLCPVLATVGGTGLVDVPGVVTIDSEGDIDLLGDGFWDCPPYGS